MTRSFLDNHDVPVKSQYCILQPNKLCKSRSENNTKNLWALESLVPKHESQKHINHHFRTKLDHQYIYIYIYWEKWKKMNKFS